MQKYTAIILASCDVNEVNRLYLMYTLEQGLVKAVAKGARKPTAKLAGHLEPGTLSEVYIARSRGMGQIAGAITLESFDKIKKDFEKLAEVLKIFRFFLKNFSEEEKDERIFNLVRDFLSLINQAEIARSMPLATEAFWWKLFDLTGYRPEVMKCVSCGEKLRANSEKYFHVEKGGAICSKCCSNFPVLMPISDNQIKLLRIFWGNELEKTARVKVSVIELKKLGKIRETYSICHFA